MEITFEAWTMNGTAVREMTPRFFQETQTFLRALPKGPLKELSSHKKSSNLCSPAILTVHCCGYCRTFPAYSASVPHQLWIRKVMSSPANTQRIHTAAVFGTIQLFLLFWDFFFFNNFNFTALVHSCAAIWQWQQQQVDVYTSGHEA